MLLIDAGNTRCKWASLEHGRWTHQGAMANADYLSWSRDFADLPAPTRIIVSNVGGELMAQRLQAVCANWRVNIEFVRAQQQQCGVHNRYAIPDQLGSDRWAALIAAWHRCHQACLVVSCGTATTVDALSSAGEFMGGLILPGLNMMQQSLRLNTAQLNDAAGQLCDFPQNTSDAIYSGILRATAGAIEHQYGLLSPHRTASCILSGGAAEQVLPCLDLPVEHVDNLVLEGLKIMGEASVC